jgi:hypothetical protein
MSILYLGERNRRKWDQHTYTYTCVVPYFTETRCAFVHMYIDTIEKTKVFVFIHVLYRLTTKQNVDFQHNPT